MSTSRTTAPASVRRYAGGLPWRSLDGAALLGAAMLDELTSSFTVVQLPLIQEHWRLSYAQAGLLLTIGGITGVLIEPWLLAWSDHTGKGPWLRAGTLILAGSFAAAAVAPTYSWLLVTLAVLGPASGLACGASQALLVDRNPGRSDLVLTRWTLAGTIGDLAGPLAVALLAACGWNWRVVLSGGGAVWLAYGVWVWRRADGPAMAACHGSPVPAAGGGVWSTVRQAAATPALWRWGLLLELVCLLDDVLVAFAALHLRHELRLGESAIALNIALFCGSGVLSLPVLERMLVRFARMTLLRASAIAALAGLALFLWAGHPITVAAALALLGIGAVGLYPILKAQVYDALPGRSGTVLTLLVVLSPLGMVQPWLLGWVADRAGLVSALALVAVCPLATLLLTPATVGVQRNGGNARR